MTNKYKELKQESVLENDLISIIVPVFNGERHLDDAIESVIAQTYKNWELLIIDDGSTDNTSKIIKNYRDNRIQYFYQKNGGVSSARNIGLKNKQGAFFCFLDSDDVLPKKSLESRIKVFGEDPQISFVDGRASIRSEDMAKEVKQWVPTFKGFPFEELIKLTGRCFFGISWMIRTEVAKEIIFDSQMTHGEDLWYFIQVSKKGKMYSYTDDVIYFRRLSSNSAMSDLDGLALGYKKLNENLLNTNVPKDWIKSNSKKARSILFKSYFNKGQFLKAIPYLFRL